MKVTPPEYTAQVPTFEIYKGNATLVDFGFFKIERRLNRRFADNEYHVTLKLPLRRRKFFDPADDDFSTGKPALFVAVGRVTLAPGGWHARGGITRVDVYHKPYAQPEPIGYKNPINLANYK